MAATRGETAARTGAISLRGGPIDLDEIDASAVD